MTEPYYHDEASGITIYHGDCREILPTLTPVGLVLTDPPYGIGWHGHPASTVAWDGFAGDDGELDIRFILGMDCAVVAFGANNYPNQLPHRGRWICWDKRTIDGAADAMLGSPFELAWSNQRSGFDRIIRVLHGGVINSDGGRRVHPTQKPLAVMRHLVEWYSDSGDSVLDPFMGSGTTLRAAKDLGRKAIGIEIEERYCEIAVKRLAQEVLL